MARQNFAHGLDQPALVDLVLGLGLLLQIFFPVLGIGEAGAEDQILDLDFAVGLFIRSLHDRAGRIAPVGIFHLLTEAVFWIAEIKLGANVCIPQGRDHFLVVGD